MKKLAYLNRNIILLTLVSLFNDFSGELLYPLIPIYLSGLGIAPYLIGVIEGTADFTTALLKLNSGIWSDKLGQRKPFILFGYTLSALSRLVLGLVNTWPGFLLARVSDRFGKGVRSSARDALLHQEAPAGKSASVFGFHRSGDSLGAVIGPLVALLLVGTWAWPIKKIFFYSIIPSSIAIFFIFLVKEKAKTQLQNSPAITWQSILVFYKNSALQYKQVLRLLIISGLFNSSDMLLLLKLKEQGYSTSATLWHYVLFNCVFVLSAFPIGVFADKWNKKYLLYLGFVVFGAAYILIAYSTSLWLSVPGIIIYGLYYSLTDGVSKVLLADTVEAHNKATALGLAGMLQSLSILIGGAMAGIIWYYSNGTMALLWCGIGTLLVGIVSFVFSKVIK